MADFCRVRIFNKTGQSIHWRVTEMQQHEVQHKTEGELHARLTLGYPDVAALEGRCGEKEEHRLTAKSKDFCMPASFNEVRIDEEDEVSTHHGFIRLVVLNAKGEKICDKQYHSTQKFLAAENKVQPLTPDTVVVKRDLRYDDNRSMSIRFSVFFCDDNEQDVKTEHESFPVPDNFNMSVEDFPQYEIMKKHVWISNKDFAGFYKRLQNYLPQV